MPRKVSKSLGEALGREPRAVVSYNAKKKSFKVFSWSGYAGHIKNASTNAIKNKPWEKSAALRAVKKTAP